jgi:hypothetical protein
MELIGLKDADHLLTFFIFDEDGFEEFTRDVEPVTDDRTILDFTIPRHLGSGFGLGTWNQRASQEGRNPWSVAFERQAYYVQNRRSVLPLLENLGADSEQTIGQRIEARRGIPLPREWVAAEAWRR